MNSNNNNDGLRHNKRQKISNYSNNTNNLTIDIICHIATYLDLDSLENLLLVNFDETETTNSLNNNVDDKKHSDTTLQKIKKAYMEAMSDNKHNNLTVSKFCDFKKPKNIVDWKILSHEWEYRGKIMERIYFDINENVVYRNKQDYGDDYYSNRHVEERIYSYGTVFDQAVVHDHRDHLDRISSYEATNKLDKTSFTLKFKYYNKIDGNDEKGDSGRDDQIILDHVENNIATPRRTDVQMVGKILVDGDFFKYSSYLLSNGNGKKNTIIENIPSSIHQKASIKNIPGSMHGFGSIRLAPSLEIQGTGINTEILNRIKKNPDFEKIKVLTLHQGVTLSCKDLEEAFLDHDTFVKMVVVGHVSQPGDEDDAVFVFGRKYKEKYPQCDFITVT